MEDIKDLTDYTGQTFKLKGIFEVQKSVKNGPWKTIVKDHNLVVKKASEILRDLMFGDEKKLIKTILFGDLGLTEDDDLKNVPEPQITDTAMVNQLYSRTLDKEKVTYEGAPAISYSVTLTEEEFNGTGSQLITEFGLIDDLNELFAKKNRAAIYKDNETSLKFIWIIVFN